MTKVTKATVKKAIKELGFNVEDFEVSAYRGCAPRIMASETAVEKRLKTVNKQVEKIARYIGKTYGVGMYGTYTGYNALVYKFEEMSYSTQLSHANID